MGLALEPAPATSRGQHVVVRPVRWLPPRSVHCRPFSPILRQHNSLSVSPNVAAPMPPGAIMLLRPDVADSAPHAPVPRNPAVTISWDERLFTRHSSPK
jgi:hypothetical protein